MKRKYMMLSMMISGPRQPGNDIDVYLGSLIEDLTKLWDEGVSVFDGFRNETYDLRVSYPNFVRGPLLDDMRPFFGPCEVLGTHH